MAKNYMADVAKMFGVELEEEFKIERHVETYKFTEEGLMYRLMDNLGWCIAPFAQNDLLTGKFEIKKLPWMPKEEEHYCYIAWRRIDNIDNIGEWKIRVETTFFTEFSAPDNLRVAVGNCFRTKKEAEAQKYEVFKRLTGKDWHETYGKEGGNNATN